MELSSQLHVHFQCLSLPRLSQALKQHAPPMHLCSRVAPADRIANVRIVTSQVHPYWRNDELLKGMKDLGIHVTAYSPLGSEVKDQPSLLQDETLKKVENLYCDNQSAAALLLLTNAPACVL